MEQESRAGLSWLEPKTLPAGFRWNNFCGVEADGGNVWAWSIAGECWLDFPPGTSGTVYYTFVVPAAGTEVEVHGTGDARRSIRSVRPWQEFSGKVEASFGDQGLRFFANRWNGQPEAFAPADSRALSLLFKTLRFAPRAGGSLPVKTKKVCPFPFSKMEVYSPHFAPCCTWWLKEELQFEGNEGDPWNSGAAQALRRSVLDGTYEFCKLDICQAPLLDRDALERAEDFDLPIAPQNLEALRLGHTFMPSGPSSVVVLADPRCNLACPSCRKGLIQELSPQESEQLRETERQLELYREQLRVLVLASNGEVFFSPWLRLKLKEASRSRYPRLEFVEIISNGILFDEKSYEQLRPGSELIRKVGISIDAGDAATYKIVRGGDWERLLKNLRWLSGLRAAGGLDRLRLNYVTRRENFRSLPAFFALAESLGVDEVFVSRALPWTGAGFHFDSQDIFRAEHPEHAEFAALWGALTAETWSFRVLGNVAEAVGSLGPADNHMKTQGL